jgi:hypothetical protein
MMDGKLFQGKLCRAERAIIGYQGIVKANTEGTIQHVIDNLDRPLINIEWDNGVTMYAFAVEVEIQQREEAIVPVCWEDDGSTTMTALRGVKIALDPRRDTRGDSSSGPPCFYSFTKIPANLG